MSKDCSASMVIVVDGKEKSHHDSISPFTSFYQGKSYNYTPDGKNVVYGAIDGRDLLWVVDPL
jgi:hypothetical protein